MLPAHLVSPSLSIFSWVGFFLPDSDTRIYSFQRFKKWCLTLVTVWRYGLDTEPKKMNPRLTFLSSFLKLASSVMSLTTTCNASREARSWKQLSDPGSKLQLTSFLQTLKTQKFLVPDCTSEQILKNWHILKMNMESIWNVVLNTSSAF